MAVSTVVQPPLVDYSFVFPVLDIDAAGNLYVAYSTSTTVHRYGVFLTRSLDSGKTWMKPVELSATATPTTVSPTPNAVMPWISAGGEGKVAVTWYQARTPTGADAIDVSADADFAPTAWDVSSAVSLDASGSNPHFANTTIVRSVHSGSICTLGGQCYGSTFLNVAAPSDRRMLDFFQNTIDIAGNLDVVYAQDQPITAAPQALSSTRTSISNSRIK